MNDSLRMRLGAVILALLTLAAVVFAVLNFQQRSSFVLPDDGVTWMDSAQGVTAWHVVADSPGAKAGIKEGDIVESVRGMSVHRATDVTRVLFHVGPWTEIRYELRREGRTFETPLVTAPQENPSSIENYLRVTALLYLFIGLFIFVRRWNAPRAIHFYIFCLVSFVLYSFHYSGKLNSFDWIIYWGNVVALLVQPALLVHFALVFPERRGKLWPKLLAVYAFPFALFLLHIFIATGTLDFLPAIGTRYWLDQLELAYLGIYFLIAAVIFLFSYRRAPSGVLRQQLKWVTGGTFAGILPFAAVLHRAVRLRPCSPAVDEFLGLLARAHPALLRLRHRPLPPDGRGHHLQARPGLHLCHRRRRRHLFRHHRPDRRTLPSPRPFHRTRRRHHRHRRRRVSCFEPLREWMQARLDRFFYRDRLDYRRTLIEFGRTLTNEVRLEPLLGSVLDRVSQTLLVDRLAIFLEDPATPGQLCTLPFHGPASRRPSRSFVFGPSPPSFARGCLFFESARAATEESEPVRRTLEELDLNYFIPCRFRERSVAVLGLGKTVDGDFLSSDDLELLFTIAGYVAIAIENARLYHSLEQKAMQIERLKDFSENIVESLNVGVLTVDLEDRIESWNPQLEDLLGISRAEALRRKLRGRSPAGPGRRNHLARPSDHVTSIYKFHLHTRAGNISSSTPPSLRSSAKPARASAA